MRHLILKIIGFIIFSVFLFSCSPAGQPEFENVAYQETLGDCENTICVNIELEYLKIKGNSNVAENFNHLIEQFIFQKMATDETITDLEPDEYVQEVIEDFKAFTEEFPDARTGGYEQTTNCEITWMDEELISIELLTSMYSGGAHPTYLDEFLNVNPKTGNIIDILDFISDHESFELLVEIKLREKLGMNENDIWADFTFIDEFTLPANIGMTEKGLSLVYNEYEILSYSEGRTEILITREELKEFSTL